MLLITYTPNYRHKAVQPTRKTRTGLYVAELLPMKFTIMTTALNYSKNERTPGYHHSFVSDSLIWSDISLSFTEVVSFASVSYISSLSVILVSALAF